MQDGANKMAVEPVWCERLSSLQSLFDAHLTGCAANLGCRHASAHDIRNGFQPFRLPDQRIHNRLKQADYRHVQPAGAALRGNMHDGDSATGDVQSDAT